MKVVGDRQAMKLCENQRTNDIRWADVDNFDMSAQILESYAAICDELNAHFSLGEPAVLCKTFAGEHLASTEWEGEGWSSLRYRTNAPRNKGNLCFRLTSSRL